MPASLYLPVFLIIIAILCYGVSFKLILSPNFYYQTQRNSQFIVLILCVIFTFWLGLRPIDKAFVDTTSYAIIYENFSSNGFNFNLGIEWAWDTIIWLCHIFGLDVHAFLLVIEAIYIFTVFYAMKYFTPFNLLIGMLFIFSSLMFFSFATNGIRNGIACHVLLLAMALYLDKKYLPATLLALLALGTHKSTVLPIIAFIYAFYLNKNFKVVLYIWIACVFVSLFTGNFFISLFGSFGFDDRMLSYFTSEYNDSFSSSGFRWDFIIYSTPPIILAWYILIKLKINDDWYRILSITYCVANAFWILVIRMAFTNRFAYLSWFLYPILIAYPLLNMPIWRDQDKTIGLFLASYCSFTLIMNVFYWSN